MPRIPQYLSTANLNPVERGGNAWEGAARRISGLYNSAASDEREAGQARARAHKQQLWPFNIMELYDRKAAEAARAAADSPSEGATNIRSIASPKERVGPNLRGETYESLANAGYGGRGSGGGGAAGQIARGAGALGSMLSDGGYGAARRTRTEDSGEAQFKAESEARRAIAEYNTQRDETVQRWTNEGVDAQDYWTRYYGGDTSRTTSAGRAIGDGTAQLPSDRYDVLGRDRGFGYGTPPSRDAMNQPEEPGYFDQALLSTGNAMRGAVDAVSSFFSSPSVVTAPIRRE